MSDQNSTLSKDQRDSSIMDQATDVILSVNQENRSLRLQVADLQKALREAQQLAVRQRHTIRKLQRGIV